MNITSRDLINRAAHVPAPIQRRFELEYAASILPEDSAAGDRETREMVADTFVSVWLPNILKTNLPSR